ncbi:ornithine cyclodeaminase family protein [Nesterenkonia muleiensis]|uniref:ornithine cyclodeaminase family protein n=1 Tax=Nesterenkonia muleiensis TaxID=2282648 RepID=UPI000E73B6CF|nr:ornithine cyclodeaminase family protein [Nesterenkonia muleiensis]
MSIDADNLPYLTAEEVRRQLSADRARELIEGALLSGFSPAEDPARVHVPAGAGHLLLMPSSLGSSVGVKIASVTPGNAARGLPRIQAVYLLLDADTLTPKALLDGSVLTALRTPATTAVACDRLAGPEAHRLVVFGSGPQAVEHTVALSRIRDLSDIRIIGRTPERTQPVLKELADRDITALTGQVEDVAEADIIVCATSAAEPLFDPELVRDGACVAAIGSHEPDRRELPGELLERALVVVEERSTAFREAGDVILAAQEGHIAESSPNLHELGALVRGEAARAEDRPNVFKGTGMSWQDLAVVAGLEV